MSDRVEFKPPQGVVPEDVKAGDTFDLVSTYRLKADGTCCLVQVGDVKMPGYEEDKYNDKNKAQNRESYSNVMQSMQSAMGGTGQAGG